MKDFDTWNEIKKKTDTEREIIGVHQRELWWAALGINVGVEIDGKQKTFERPVVILRKFNNQMIWILPVTSQEKSTPFYERFIFGGNSYFAALTQLRTVSTKRLLRKIGMIPKDYFVRMQENIVSFVKMNEDPQSGSSRRPKP